MEKFRLRIEDTGNGCYLYIEGEPEDVLLTPELVTDEYKCELLKYYASIIEYRLFAYERYKSALNTTLKMLRDQGVGPPVTAMVVRALRQFNDLDMPGDLRKK